MKKNLIFICSFIILIFLFSATALASEYKSEVSVGLLYGEEAGNSVNVSSQGGFDVFDAAIGTLLYSAQPGEEIDILMGSTGFASLEKFDASGIAKISVQPREGATIFCNKREYRGYIYLERTQKGELLVINYVGTDDYVTSVLGKEMSYSWPIEALKAQAVCARNFVLCRGNAHKEYGFDVCTTTHCQVYGGVLSEHENTRRATEETKGVLAKYNGKIVPLYFFATSGGYTENAENVWTNAQGYLKAVSDPYENPQKASKYAWNESRTKEEIEEKLASLGVLSGSLTNITVDKVSESGRVTEMTFHMTGGKHTVRNEKCRTILGLYSQKFTVLPDSVKTLATTAGTANAPYYVCTDGGVKTLSGYSVISGDGKITKLSVNSGGAQGYSISGGGYGHGVGMSQWGARGMAENGFTYEEILTHYFTDIELG